MSTRCDCLNYILAYFFRKISIILLIIKFPGKYA